MAPIRVLIVDDHTLFREGVLAILKGAADVEAVGEAATGQEAVEQATLLSPEVILMDIQMPDMNGIEATQAILNANPNIGIIMVTMLEDGVIIDVFSPLREDYLWNREYTVCAPYVESLLIALHTTGLIPCKALVSLKM